MNIADHLIEELVTANRILAREGVVDSFGHISLRHPGDPGRFAMSCARAPERVEPADFMEFTLDGAAVDAKGRRPYLERFIHAAVYAARADVVSVVHNHSPSVIPFGVTGQRLKPIMHLGAAIGHEVPVWDSRDRFGDTSLLVQNLEMGRDLAALLGPHTVAMMRGHGCVVAGKSIRWAVYASVYLEVNAGLQLRATALGPVKYLSPGEIDAVIAMTTPAIVDRAWENWCLRAGRKFIPAG